MTKYFGKRGVFGQDGWIKISFWKYFCMRIDGGYVLKKEIYKRCRYYDEIVLAKTIIWGDNE